MNSYVRSFTFHLITLYYNKLISTQDFMMPEKVGSKIVEAISYEKYGIMLDRLGDILKGNEFTKVYGPPRGGLPIAVHMSHCFDLPLIMSEVDLYNMNNWLPQDRLLLVDDIVDTGHTLETISTRLNIRHIDHFTAVLYKKNRTTFIPDLFLESCESWIVFPWERPDEPQNR